LHDFGADNDLDIEYGKTLSAFNLLKINLVKKEALKYSKVPFVIRKQAATLMVDYPLITIEDNKEVA
jgi:hypothetical protein